MNNLPEYIPCNMCVDVNIQIKKCNRCNIEKDITEFYKNKRAKDGLYGHCIACEKQYNKINIDKRREERKKYYQLNIETIKGRNKKWYEINIEIKKEYDKQYRFIHAEKRKQYRKDNIKKSKLQAKQHRQAKCIYVTHCDKLMVYNNIRQSSEGFLEVQCKYCNQWIIPTNQQVKDRLISCESINQGESHFYCNNNNNACKHACPTFRKQMYPKGFKVNTSREVIPELRKMCFEKDNWTCIKCGNTNKNSQLHCHHIEGVVQSPMLANDIDNVITVCKECHKEIHKQKGCSYVDYRRDKC